MKLYLEINTENKYKVQEALKSAGVEANLLYVDDLYSEIVQHEIELHIKRNSESLLETFQSMKNETTYEEFIEDIKEELYIEVYKHGGIPETIQDSIYEARKLYTYNLD